jgi:hypothetical protein
VDLHILRIILWEFDSGVIWDIRSDEARSNKGSLETTYTVGILPPGFTELIPLKAPVTTFGNKALFRVHVLYKREGQSKVRDANVFFHHDELKAGALFNDGSLISEDAFLARDSCKLTRYEPAGIPSWPINTAIDSHFDSLMHRAHSRV